jgi:hypothetical protein
MKSHFLTIIILAIAKLVTSQNASILIGHWQYYDNKNIYHEIVIEKSKGYIIGDSLDPAILYVAVDSTSVLWRKLGKWTIINIENGHLVIQSPKGQLNLYKLPYKKNNLKAFYQWANNTTRTGNGFIIFYDEFKKRKAKLEVKIKNDL